MIYNGKECELISKHNGYAVIRNGEEIICVADSDLEEKQEEKPVKKSSTRKKKEIVND